MSVLLRHTVNGSKQSRKKAAANWKEETQMQALRVTLLKGVLVTLSGKTIYKKTCCWSLSFVIFAISRGILKVWQENKEWVSQNAVMKNQYARTSCEISADKIQKLLKSSFSPKEKFAESFGPSTDHKSSNFWQQKSDPGELVNVVVHN